jgi:hypothetical protein
MQNREFAAHFAMHWFFTNWVKLKFGHGVNRDIIFLHKKIQINPLCHFGFMIKFVTAAATENFVAPSYKIALQIS